MKQFGRKKKLDVTTTLSKVLWTGNVLSLRGISLLCLAGGKRTFNALQNMSPNKSLETR